MFIQKIIWLEDSCLEAKLIVSDGFYSLLCFSCPCEYAVGDKLHRPLECLDVQDICVVKEGMYNIEKGKNPFSYLLCGKIGDINKGIVSVGEIKLHIEQNRIPKDIQFGQFVCFSTSRIDIY